jgi:hypothetical protein
MERNLERIEGAKETGIHPVAGGETAGGSETPAARRAARVCGGARRRLSRPAGVCYMYMREKQAIQCQVPDTSQSPT